MNKSTESRKRYPSKLSIIAITDEMRQRIKDLQKVQKLLSEADIVRAALDQYLPGKKESNEKNISPLPQ